MTRLSNVDVIIRVNRTLQWEEGGYRLRIHSLSYAIHNYRGPFFFLLAYLLPHSLSLSPTFVSCLFFFLLFFPFLSMFGGATRESSRRINQTAVVIKAICRVTRRRCESPGRQIQDACRRWSILLITRKGERAASFVETLPSYTLKLTATHRRLDSHRFHIVRI